MSDNKYADLPGNAEKYSPAHVAALEHSPIKGRKLIFLGSSVTYGYASNAVSFADYIGVRNGCIIVKEAVSGTTLVDDREDSYIARMKQIRAPEADLFVCQLSTNDASKGKPLGSISEGFDKTLFDTSTVAGAIEYIIAYAEKTWHCPVVFYTSPRYDKDEYAAMVELLWEIARKWKISVIDMWNDEQFNMITDEQRMLYMKDPVHPTQAGYLEWWTPYIESRLYVVLV